MTKRYIIVTKQQNGGVMKVKIQVNGLDKLDDLFAKARKQLSELQDTITEIDIAVYSLEAELNQPTAGTIG